MSLTVAPDRWELLEREAEALHDRIRELRRSMTRTRAAAWVGAVGFVAAFFLAPTSNRPGFVLLALTVAIASLIWLGSTSASLHELEARLVKLTAEQDAMYDSVARVNGWPPRPISSGRRNPVPGSIVR